MPCLTCDSSVEVNDGRDYVPTSREVVFGHHFTSIAGTGPIVGLVDSGRHHIIAAQSIGEPGTQLTMRTFHIGGAAQRGSEQSNIEADFKAKVSIVNRNVVTDDKGLLVVMARNTEVVLSDNDGRERARFRVPYGARLTVDEGAEVTRGTRLAEWDPYTLPIIAERDGIANYVDLVEGTSVREIMDESTGISYKKLIDWKQQPKGADLRPMITLCDDKGTMMTLASGAEARYFLSVDAILSVESGAKIHAGDVLARVPRESTKTRDITGGLPRVAELFEARKPKDFSIMAEVCRRSTPGASGRRFRCAGCTPVRSLVTRTAHRLWRRARTSP